MSWIKSFMHPCIKKQTFYFVPFVYCVNTFIFILLLLTTVTHKIVLPCFKIPSVTQKNYRLSSSHSTCRILETENLSCFVPYHVVQLLRNRGTLQKTERIKTHYAEQLIWVCGSTREALSSSESHPLRGFKSTDCRLGQGFPAPALRALIQQQQQQGGYLVMANVIPTSSYSYCTHVRCSQTFCRSD